VTPATTEDILVGVTRNSIIRLATEKLGFPVEERPVGRSELYQAEEAFLCGTGAEIAAIGEIDGRVLGDGQAGPITTRLRTLYQQAVLGGLDGYQAWLTPAYERGRL
jgi:branched-chain amino acid aminotransferase